MIKAYCRTNLDGFDCSNITAFVALPREGDKVEVKYRGEPAILTVCGITHKMKDKEDRPRGYHIPSEDMIPIIEVELTGRPIE